jgi:xylose isomerase
VVVRSFCFGPINFSPFGINAKNELNNLSPFLKQFLEKQGGGAVLLLWAY